MRLGGLSAHEATARAANIRVTMMCQAASPQAACDAAAPVRSKKVPAYAHSLRRGKRGANKAMAPSTF